MILLSVVPEPPEGWERQAACDGVGPAEFYADDFPDEDHDRTYYGTMGWRSACHGCPVRASCLAHALRNRESWGVWGGLPPPARRTLAALLADGAITWERVTVSFEA